MSVATPLSTFDPFGASSASTQNFGDFASSSASSSFAPAPMPPASQQSMTFDPFGGNASVTANTAQYQAPQQQQMNSFQAGLRPTFSQQQMMGGVYSHPPPSAHAATQSTVLSNTPSQYGQLSAQSGVQSRTSSNLSGATSHSHPSTTTSGETKRDDAWGAGSSLFDLSNLGSSGSKCASGQSSNSQSRNLSSFSGLDTLAGMPSRPSNMQPGGMGPGMGMGGPMGMTNMHGGMPHASMGMHPSYGNMGGMPMGMNLMNVQHHPNMNVMGMQHQHPGGPNMMGGYGNASQQQQFTNHNNPF